jgi:hypothetical protein
VLMRSARLLNQRKPIKKAGWLTPTPPLKSVAPRN